MIHTISLEQMLAETDDLREENKEKLAEIKIHEEKDDYILGLALRMGPLLALHLAA